MRLLLVVVAGLIVLGLIVGTILIPMAASRGGIPWAGEERKRKRS